MHRARRTCALALLLATVLAACGTKGAKDEATATPAAAVVTVPAAPATSAGPSPAADTTVTAAPETSTTSAPSVAAAITAEASAPPVLGTPAAPAPPPTTTRAPRTAPTTAPPVRTVGSIDAYEGLGTWVDVYDWSHYRGTTPTVGPAEVDQMAAQGVQTLFLQTAKHDTPDLISEPELLLPIIQRAHERNIKVVAWYLPTLVDPGNDLQRLLASAKLDVDGIAVDIESRDVADPIERNRRLVGLSTALREALPGRAIGAIIVPPVVLEVVNANFWPNFPYREIAPSYDVWQVMGYWTNRTVASSYRDPFRYTDESIRRLRNNLGQPTAPVHPIGGVGADGEEIEAFLAAAVKSGAIGGSVYDWRTTKPDAWSYLRKFRGE